jgi:hypothetical protein
VISRDGHHADIGLWTALPCIELKGLGTSIVESIDHYIARLSWMTATSMSRIIADGKKPFRVARRILDAPSRLIGPGTEYIEAISSLEMLTGVPTLRHGSLYVIDNLLLLRAGNDISRHHRWCPQCYLNWDERNSYEPLIWQIGLRKTCPLHACCLESRCRNCDATMTASVLYKRRRECSQCGNSLGGTARYPDLTTYEQWMEQQLEKLIEICASPGRSQISGDIIAQFRKAMSSSISEMRSHTHKHALVAMLGNQARTRRNYSRFSMSRMIHLCAVQGISIADFIERPSEASAKPLFKSWSSYIPLRIPKENVVTRIKLVRTAIRRILALREIEYLPHPHMWSHASGLSEEILITRNLPEYRRYLLKYSSQPSSLTNDEIQLIFEKILEALEFHLPNPFQRYVTKHLTYKFREISMSEPSLLLVIIRSAILWRRNLEISKSKLLKMSRIDLNFHKCFGGLFHSNGMPKLPDSMYAQLKTLDPEGKTRAMLKDT